jgi:hypothetical protein
MFLLNERNSCRIKTAAEPGRRSLDAFGDTFERLV